MARKKGYDYFENFVKMADHSYQAALMLEQILLHFDARVLQDKLDELHKLEHSADLEQHEMLDNLFHEFITPIEREDIMELAHAIDDVTDNLEEVLLQIYMLNIRAMRPDALEMVRIVVNCCLEMKTAVENFQNFKKAPDTLRQSILQVHTLEEQGDKRYTDAMRHLHLTVFNAVEIVRWTKAFDTMESCCDSCEGVVEVLERVMMKNS